MPNGSVIGGPGMAERSNDGGKKGVFQIFLYINIRLTHAATATCQAYSRPLMKKVGSESFLFSKKGSTLSWRLWKQRNFSGESQVFVPSALARVNCGEADREHEQKSWWWASLECFLVPLRIKKTWEHELAELTPVLLSPSVLLLLRPWLSCCNIERNRETRQLKSKCWKAGQHRNHHRTMEPWNHCLPALILGISNTKWLERYWSIAADIKCFVMISDVISRILCVYTQLQSAASSQTVRRRIVLRMSS